MKMQTTYNSTDVIDFANYVKWLEENHQKPKGEKADNLDFEDWKLTKGLNKGQRETKLAVKQLYELLLPIGFNHKKTTKTIVLDSFGGGDLSFTIQNVSENSEVLKNTFSINGRTMELKKIE